MMAAELNLAIESAEIKSAEIASSVLNWIFSGDLTVFPLSKQANSWIKLFPTEGKWLISGQNISRIDTAGLAFLLECIAHAKAKAIELKFISLPSAVSPLMKAQGVENLITAHVEK
jgi:ABC-type transporter Mla MlaB component